MQPPRFFHLLLLSLIAQGDTHINLCGDAHHHQLERVANFLSHPDNAEEVKEASLEGLCLVPNPFTGRFKGWDEALLSAQPEFVTTSFYNDQITFKIDPPTAHSLIEKSDPKVSSLFKKLAFVFNQN